MKQLVSSRMLARQVGALASVAAALAIGNGALIAVANAETNTGGGLDHDKYYACLSDAQRARGTITIADFKGCCYNAGGDWQQGFTPDSGVCVDPKPQGGTGAQRFPGSAHIPTGIDTVTLTPEPATPPAGTAG